MKAWMVAALGFGTLSGVGAQEVGQVLSSTPVVQQVAVPRRVCSDELISYQGPNSGAGVLIGAIVGGALGNAAGGQGAGRATATVMGMVGGAVVGDRFEGAAPERFETVRRCTLQNFYEQRTLGYQVVYEFGGRQYAVQMPSDPGPTIALQVSPLGAELPLQTPPAAIVVQPTATYITVPVARSYYGPAYYPPVRLSFGFYGHSHRHHRGHERWHR
jgi:uncharacterized protein YcfJ